MFLKIRLATKLLCFIAPILVVATGIVFTWIIKNEEHLIRREIEKKAKLVAQQLEIMREYIAEKQDVINTDPETGNVTFKHLNPAKVGTEISKRFSVSTNYIMKQTSLKYRNPANAPDEFEIKALKQLQTEKNEKAIWGEDHNEEGKKIIRYMIPLYIKEECLACHGRQDYEGELDITGHKKEGYKLGELRGAISVIAPAEPIEAVIKSNSLILLSIGVVSMIAVIFLTYLLIRRFVRVPLSLTVDTTRAIASGDLSKRVDVRSGDEFGELAESFNTMAESIEEKTKALEETTRNLEKANEELRGLDEMKDNIIRDVSHELKSPLAQLRLALELWVGDKKGERKDGSKDGSKEDLFDGIIKENIKRLNKTIESILELTSLESGREDYDKESLQLKKLITQVIKSSTLSARQKGLVIRSKLPGKLPNIVVDRQGITRVVANLIDNAIKYTDSGEILISLQQKNSELEFSVKDSGIGISLSGEQQYKLFERFYQENASIPGAGVGLSICKTIVEAHGGKIWAESEGKGKGSIFRFTLPLVIEEALIATDAQVNDGHQIR
ncbi:MAG: sensor histidine kinase [Planctomycetota bacterium]|jgi:signal transduction histidine kinase